MAHKNTRVFSHDKVENKLFKASIFLNDRQPLPALDYKLTYGNKNQTANTHTVYKVQCPKTKQNKTETMKYITKLA